MHSWFYKAIDQEGQARRGIIEASSEAAAKKSLKEDGLIAHHIRAKTPHKLDFNIFSSISTGELSIFSRQLATLLNAGLNVEQSLSILVEQVDNQKLREAIKKAHSDVLSGHGLGKALSLQKRIFPQYYCAIISAAESAGALPETAERLAEEQENLHSLRMKTIMALTYPAIVSVVALLVIIFLLTYVVPQIVAVFESSKHQLPFLTRIVIHVSDLMIQYWWAILLSIIFLLLTIDRIIKNDAARYKLHKFLLNVPVLADLRRALSTAQFSKTMAILLKGGVPTPAAFGYASEAVRDKVFSEAIKNVSSRVREGVAVNRAISEEKIFPSILIHLVKSGESTGRLSQSFMDAGNQQAKQAESKLAVLTSLLEPLLILIMGAMVLVIVLATLEPLIQMNNIIQ
jgi:general secretion pathway protein F